MEEIRKAAKPIEMAGIETFNEGIQRHIEAFIKAFVDKGKIEMGEKEAFMKATLIIISVLLGKAKMIGGNMGQLEEIKRLFSMNESDLELMAAAAIRKRMAAKNK